MVKTIVSMLVGTAMKTVFVLGFRQTNRVVNEAASQLATARGRPVYQVIAQDQAALWLLVEITYFDQVTNRLEPRIRDIVRSFEANEDVLTDEIDEHLVLDDKTAAYLSISEAFEHINLDPTAIALTPLRRKQIRIRLKATAQELREELVSLYGLYALSKSKALWLKLKQ